MADEDGFTAETLAEQWAFDYYVDKCLSNYSRSGEMDDSSRQILQALMFQCIDPNYGMNEMKAHMLIVMDYQLQLAELDIDNPESSNSHKMLQSKEAVTEFFALMDGLKNSLDSLITESKELHLSRSTVRLCETCLRHTYVSIFQVLHRLRHAPEPLYDISELKERATIILRKAGRGLDSASKTEENIVEACKNLFKGRDQSEKDLPHIHDLITLLNKLVSEIHQVFPKPQLLKLAESYNRLEIKLEEMGNKDLLSSGATSKASLEKLARLNNSSSTDNGRSRKETKHRVVELSSSDGSDSDEVVSFPHKGRNGEQIRSRSPQERPGVSRVVKKFKVMDRAWNAKPLDKLSKKPASHARVKLGPWTPAQEEKFILSVLRIGVGKWAQVKEDIQAIRSSVQLKDKWRNIPKSRIKSIAREHNLPFPPPN